MHWELIEKISGANQTFAGVFRTHRAQRPTDKMADDTDAGLPVRQLLKMVASGDLSPAEFKQLTKHVIGPPTGQSAETLYVIGAFLACCAVNIPIYWQYLEGFEPILNINS